MLFRTSSRSFSAGAGDACAWPRGGCGGFGARAAGAVVRLRRFLLQLFHCGRPRGRFLIQSGDGWRAALIQAACSGGGGCDRRAVYRSWLRRDRHARAEIATRAPPFCRAARRRWPLTRDVDVWARGGRGRGGDGRLWLTWSP